MIDWKKVKGERSRTYHFPGGNSVTFEGVTKLAVRPSGTHRLELSGRKVIVAAGWLWIEINAQEWAF